MLCAHYYKKHFAGYLKMGLRYRNCLPWLMGAINEDGHFSFKETFVYNRLEKSFNRGRDCYTTSSVNR